MEYLLRLVLHASSGWDLMSDMTGCEVKRDKHTPESSRASFRYIYRDPLGFMRMEKGLHDNSRIRMGQDLGRSVSIGVLRWLKANGTCHRIILDESQSQLGDLLAIREGLGRILSTLVDEFSL